MSRFRIAPRAQKDLDGIWDYIGVVKDRPVAATRQIERLFERFRLLASHPLMGEQRDDVSRGLRGFTSGRYVILYRVVTEGVEIAAVIHGSRDIRSAFYGTSPEGADF